MRRLFSFHKLTVLCFFLVGIGSFIFTPQSVQAAAEATCVNTGTGNIVQMSSYCDSTRAPQVTYGIAQGGSVSNIAYRVAVGGGYRISLDASLVNTNGTITNLGGISTCTFSSSAELQSGPCTKISAQVFSFTPIWNTATGYNGGAWPSGTIRLTVGAVDSNGNSGGTSPYILFQLGTVPQVPTFVGTPATTPTAHSLDVAWSQNVPPAATGHHIYIRKDTDAGYPATPSQDVVGTASRATFTGLNPRTRYCFVVSAYNAIGESARSTETSASCTTTALDTAIAKPPTPTNFTATPGTNNGVSGSVNLAWTNPAGSNATSITVMVNGYSSSPRLAATQTSVTISGLTCMNVQSSFSIYASNSGGDSNQFSPTVYLWLCGPPPTPYTISGTILNAAGAGIAGVTVKATGSYVSPSALTNASGAYTITGLAYGGYSLAATKAGYTFAPPTYSTTVYTNLTGYNFTGSAVPPATTYTISGVVMKALGTSVQSPVQGTTVTLSGIASATTITAAGGAYTFTGLAPGNYIVAASGGSYVYTPSTKSVTIVAANSGENDFNALYTPPTYTISGHIQDSTGTALSGVSISSPGLSTATSNTTGDYTISGAASGTYVLTPSKTSYTFAPTTRTVLVGNGNVVSQNFTGSLPVTPSPSATPTPTPTPTPATPTISPSPGAPSAPVLTSAISGSTAITLTWQAVGSGQVGYKIYRKLPTDASYTTYPNSYISRADGASTTSYINSNLHPGDSYCYKIAAYNGIGNSALSNEKCAIIADIPPVLGLTVTKPSSTSPFSFDQSTVLTLTFGMTNQSVGNLKLKVWWNMTNDIIKHYIVGTATAGQAVSVPSFVTTWAPPYAGGKICGLTTCTPPPVLGTGLAPGEYELWGEVIDGKGGTGQVRSKFSVKE